MAVNRYVKTALKLFAVFFVLIGLWFVHNFVYPFRSDNPNFNDVEEVFSRMTFPDDWEEIDSSENKGLYGRSCPPLGSDTTCFHKSKTFSVVPAPQVEKVEEVLKKTNCEPIQKSDNTKDFEYEKSTNLRCQFGKLRVGASIRGPENEVYIGVTSL